MTTSPAEATPDRALVFEVIGPVANFIAAARAAGLEWLAEDIDDRPDPDSDDEPGGDDEEPFDDTTLYLTMPTLAGLQRLLALWRRFARGEAKPSDAREWWNLFGYLKDVRTWSAKDRVDPATRAYVERMLVRHPGRPVRIELDLWFREDPELRHEARTYVDALMGAMEGRVLDFATITPIRYQAALVELPARQARMLQGLAGPLAVADGVMRVRPQSLYTAIGMPNVSERGRGQSLQQEEPRIADAVPALMLDVGRRGASVPPDPRAPIAALLDGYPIANHRLLANRLAITEVDVSARDVPVRRRFHGTSMASLILHGDLARDEEPLNRTLKVIPVLAAPQGLHEECTPPESLPIAMVYRAVTALVAGSDGEAPAGERVVIINHSICDQQAPFARRPTPWAKLLDFLSHEHRLLFVVSAGNTREPFEIDTYVDCADFGAANPVERQIVLLRAIERAKGRRMMLSPAESLNSLTVGALHEDGSSGCPPGQIDPFAAIGVTNVSSTAGLGINRGIKPDLVEAGGRQLVGTDTEDEVVSVWGTHHPDVGQLAASADPEGGTTSLVARSSGTSNAAALVTRSAIRLADAVESLFAADGKVWGLLPTRAAVLKALLLHGCSWGAPGALLESTYPPPGTARWARRREAVARFMGYGRQDSGRVLDAKSSRVTLLADDEIGHDELHEYRLPIPRAMIGNRELRRVVLTLAWSSPIDPASARYRGVALELVDAQGKRHFWPGVRAIPQPHADATRRGTAQHLVLEGKNLMSAARGGDIFLGVQARAVLSRFDEEMVPYALAVTLEMAQPLRSTVFADVAARVRPKVPPIATRIQTKVKP